MTEIWLPKLTGESLLKIPVIRADLPLCPVGAEADLRPAPR